MLKMSVTKTQGVLTNLFHCYKDRNLEYSVLYIQEKEAKHRTDREGSYFYGYVPTNLIGKDVHLSQSRGKDNLFQMLTSGKEGENMFRINVDINLKLLERDNPKYDGLEIPTFVRPK